jgi:hypothetical protein
LLALLVLVTCPSFSLSSLLSSSSPSPHPHALVLALVLVLALTFALVLVFTLVFTCSSLLPHPTPEVRPDNIISLRYVQSINTIGKKIFTLVFDEETIEFEAACMENRDDWVQSMFFF